MTNNPGLGPATTDEPEAAPTKQKPDDPAG
ncbi:MAG: hypothetical protein JWM76_650, partial [Pseudonocardiales bacterium]|nr:hypothetical protein [Pseudonocardiales bacterium]